MKNYRLDSYAILAILYNEAGAQEVARILQEVQKSDVHVYMNVANLGEVYYSLAREEGEREAIKATADIKSCGIQLVPLDERLALAVARIKATHRMSYADCIAAATARDKQAIILIGDPEFHAIEENIAIQWLPKNNKS